GMPFRKGADLFIEVGVRLRRAHNGGIQLLWIGEFPEDEPDPQHGDWAAHLAKLREDDAANVAFVGFREDARRCLRAADIFLLTSREDPFPLVALEAAAFGLPLVCFEGSGGMPAFVDRDAGVAVPFENAASMAAEVAALAADEPRRRALGARAREKVLSRCTTDVAVPHVLSTCRAVARQRPALS